MPLRSHTDSAAGTNQAAPSNTNHFTFSIRATTHCTFLVGSCTQRVQKIESRSQSILSDAALCLSAAANDIMQPIRDVALQKKHSTHFESFIARLHAIHLRLSGKGSFSWTILFNVVQQGLLHVFGTTTSYFNRPNTRDFVGTVSPTQRGATALSIPACNAFLEMLFLLLQLRCTQMARVPVYRTQKRLQGSLQLHRDSLARAIVPDHPKPSHSNPAYASSKLPIAQLHVSITTDLIRHQRRIILPEGKDRVYASHECSDRPESCFSLT